MYDAALSELSRAIEQLNGAKPGTTEFVLQQAFVFGKSMLNKAQRLDIQEGEALDRFRKKCREQLQLIDDSE